MEETKPVVTRVNTSKSVPRIYGRMVDGKLIEVDVKDCQACPVNHCEYCNFEGVYRKFTSSEVSEMKKNGFPKFCTLRINN